VVVNCDSNFMFCYGVYQFHCYLAREKNNACVIFVSIFVVHHHVKVPKAILC
jgi:hypothetical protein